MVPFPPSARAAKPGSLIAGENLMTLAELGPCLGGALTAARSRHAAIGGNFRHPSLFWSLLETVHMNHLLSSRGPVCLISSKTNGRGCACWAAWGRGGGGQVLWASLGVPGPEGVWEDK